MHTSANVATENNNSWNSLGILFFARHLAPGKMFLLLWKSRRFAVMVLLFAREIKPCGNSQYLYAQLSMCRQDASSRNMGCIIILFITLKHMQP